MACHVQHPSTRTLELSCGCSFCAPCLEMMFATALNDEQAYPPRCLDGAIPFKHARRHISPKLARDFKSKRLEYSTKNRTYCHQASCDTFIAAQSIHNGQAFCQKCNAATCIRCKRKWHFGSCAEDTTPQELKELVQREGWKTCPNCRRIVERVDGCNHMA